MPIPFECPSCHAAYEVADDVAGKDVLCRECENRVSVEDPTGRHISFRCPHCREQTELPITQAGRWLRCPNCQTLAKVTGGDANRPTRRRVLFAAGGVFLSVVAVTGIFWSRGKGKDEQPSEQSPKRRPRGQAPDQQPGGAVPGQKGGRGRGRKGGGRGGQGAQPQPGPI